MEELTAITEDLIKRHLGRASTEVLKALFNKADNGVVQVRRKDLATDTGVSLSSIKDAMRKLTAIEVIKKNTEVKTERGFTAYDIVGSMPSVGVMMLTNEVASNIMSRPTHGGARKGAGRPKGSKNKVKAPVPVSVLEEVDSTKE